MQDEYGLQDMFIVENGLNLAFFETGTPPAMLFVCRQTARSHIDEDITGEFL
ncbi:MAG: hypothetical protein ABL918_10665 [Chakrabartia sp.]